LANFAGIFFSPIASDQVRTAATMRLQLTIVRKQTQKQQYFAGIVALEDILCNKSDLPFRASKETRSRSCMSGFSL
jgi:hypothetical protein